jgi:hypothetical protein
MLYQESIEQPSIKRLLLLIKLTKKYSILRSLQYENLDNFFFSGITLDFGGGEKAEYRKRLNINGSYKSVNIDKSIMPTWVVAVEDSWPSSVKNLDNVISLNTLEHIYEVKKTINSIYDGLKKGGILIASTPFIFGIHGHPNDFNRPTPEWYQNTLSAQGFTSCKIKHLYWGPFTNSSVISRNLIPRRIGNLIALILDYFFYRAKKLLKKKINLPTTPIGLWVEAVK